MIPEEKVRFLLYDGEWKETDRGLTMRRQTRIGILCAETVGSGERQRMMVIVNVRCLLCPRNYFKHFTQISSF